jgi:hypothetical protein
MGDRVLPAISLRHSGAIVTLLLLGGCANSASLANSFVATNTATATREQLESCRNQVGQAFVQVPYSQINVTPGSADSQGNAIVNWQITNGAAGSCRVDSFNNITEFAVAVNPSPSPSPTQSPVPSPSPTQNQLNPQSLVGLNLDQAIATASNFGYSVVDTSNPDRIYLSNNQQQIILSRDAATNTVTSVAVVRAPSPSPSPTAFDPQSLVGLGRNQAIETAQANGYSILDDTNQNQIVMSNGQQQITLNIGRLFNRVSAVEVASAPAPSPQPSPGFNTREQELAQLESCRNYVSSIYPNVPFENVTVYVDGRDQQGNTILRWQAGNVATGFCQMDGLNPTIAQFVVEQENTAQQSPTPSRPTVNGLW